jgi:hypothetical protein
MSWNGQLQWPPQPGENQGQASASQLQPSFLPFASVHGQQAHGFGGHGNAAWNGAGGWDPSQQGKIPWQGWDPNSDPSKRQAISNDMNSKMPSAVASGQSMRGNGSSDNRGQPLTLTGEQILCAALKLEEALINNRITPEQAIELSIQYQAALAESMAQRKPSQTSLPQNTNGFSGSDSEGFSPKVHNPKKRHRRC